MDADTGAASVVWSAVQHRLSKHTAAVCYDRAGLGYSPPTTAPRSVLNRTSELFGLLSRLGLEGDTAPTGLVLVGHGQSCLSTLLYKLRFPDAVVGVVLVEPPPALCTAVATAVTSKPTCPPVPPQPSTICQSPPLTLRLRAQAAVAVAASTVVDIASYLNLAPVVSLLQAATPQRRRRHSPSRTVSRQPAVVPACPFTHAHTSSLEAVCSSFDTSMLASYLALNAGVLASVPLLVVSPRSASRPRSQSWPSALLPCVPAADAKAYAKLAAVSTCGRHVVVDAAPPLLATAADDVANAVRSLLASMP